MDIKIEESENEAHMVIEGDLTIYAAEQFKLALFELIADVKTLSVNLSDVNEIDSTGIQILAMAKSMATLEKNTFKLENLSDAVKNVFSLYFLNEDTFNVINES